MLSAIAFGATIAGCSASTTQTGAFLPADHAPVMAARPAVSVDMYWGAPPVRPYRTLGQIILEPDRASGLDHTSVLDLYRQIRRAGGAHGCDAVVVDRGQGGHSVWQQTASCLQYTAAAGSYDPDLRGPSSAKAR